MKKLLLLSVLLSGCASIEPVAFKGPNGNTAYSMRCSGAGRTLDACYQKAGEICPKGYTIIDRASTVVGIPANYGTIIAPRHNLAVECK